MLKFSLTNYLNVKVRWKKEIRLGIVLIIPSTGAFVFLSISWQLPAKNLPFTADSHTSGFRVSHTC